MKTMISSRHILRSPQTRSMWMRIRPSPLPSRIRRYSSILILAALALRTGSSQRTMKTGGWMRRRQCSTHVLSDTKSLQMPSGVHLQRRQAFRQDLPSTQRTKHARLHTMVLNMSSRHQCGVCLSVVSSVTMTVPSSWTAELPAVMRAALRQHLHPHFTLTPMVLHATSPMLLPVAMQVRCVVSKNKYLYYE